MTRKKITSVSNPLIRQTAEIVSARQRGDREFFVAEGPHAVRASIDSGAAMREVFYTEEFGSAAEGAAFIELIIGSKYQPSSLIDAKNFSSLCAEAS